MFQVERFHLSSSETLLSSSSVGIALSEDDDRSRQLSARLTSSPQQSAPEKTTADAGLFRKLSCRRSFNAGEAACHCRRSLKRYRRLRHCSGPAVVPMRLPELEYWREGDNFRPRARTLSTPSVSACQVSTGNGRSSNIPDARDSLRDRFCYLGLKESSCDARIQGCEKANREIFSPNQNEVSRDHFSPYKKEDSRDPCSPNQNETSRFSCSPNQNETSRDPCSPVSRDPCSPNQNEDSRDPSSPIQKDVINGPFSQIKYANCDPCSIILREASSGPSSPDLQGSLYSPIQRDTNCGLYSPGFEMAAGGLCSPFTEMATGGLCSSSGVHGRPNGVPRLNLLPSSPSQLIQGLRSPGGQNYLSIGLHIPKSASTAFSRAFAGRFMSTSNTGRSAVEREIRQSFLIIKHSLYVNFLVSNTIFRLESVY